MNNLFNKIKNYKDELPGAIAHKAMAPIFNGNIFRKMQSSSADCRKSAVILPLYEIEDNIEILFTRRSINLSHHPGQISFPGGRLEMNETPLEAAYREIEEEVGIKGNHIEFLGSLSELYLEPSNNMVYPFVCKINTQEIMIDKTEVDSVLFKNLNFFLDDNNRKTQKQIIDRKEILVPFWDIGSEVPLWGATAMIINEFVELVKILAYV